MDTWDNYLYMPSDVTHMNNYFSGSIDNSSNVIDRFWIIDPDDNSDWNYIPSDTNNTTAIDFTYDPGEITSGNTITSSSLLSAQRFNSSTNQWGDYLPFSNCIIPNVTTSIPAFQMYRSWTLSSQMVPLPVELIGFGYDCSDTKTILKWSVGSEANISHYIIERSIDNQIWSMVDQIQGMGNYQGEINYSIQSDLGQYYYKLTSVDLDGAQEELFTIYAICGGSTIQIISGYSLNNNIGMVVSSSESSYYKLKVTDFSGRIISDSEVIVNKGVTNLVGWDGILSSGIYSMILYNDYRSLFIKVFNL